MYSLKKFITLLCCITAISCYANDYEDIIQAADSVATDSMPKKRNFIGRIINYFNESNKPKSNKRFDFSVIGGPYYSSDTKLGLGVVAAGLYRTDVNDTLLPPSDVSLYANATTSAYFLLGVKGNHIHPHDAARLTYDVYFASIKSKFWGIGYDDNINDENESNYKYLNSRAVVNYVWRLAPNLYAGPMAAFDLIDGRRFDKPWLWDGEAARTVNLGVGFTAQFDNRDFLTNASHGWYVRVDQRFNPKFLFNKYAFSLTEGTVAYYRPLWRGATLASQFHTRITYGNTPWGLLSTIGGSYTMRGYYEGRFRDKGEMDLCIELRQHVWRRNGITLWAGAASLFPKFSEIKARQILPNYGIGYRWEFKKRVNIRLDLGFGRKQTGFIFSINEAF